MSESETAAAPETVIETRLLEIPGGVPDLDAPAKVVAAGAEASGQPIRMRMTAGLFLPASRAQYKYWRGVSWKMEFRSLGDIIQFREDLGAFIAGWFEARKGEPS